MKFRIFILLGIFIISIAPAQSEIFYLNDNTYRVPTIVYYKDISTNEMTAPDSVLLIARKANAISSDSLGYMWITSDTTWCHTTTTDAGTVWDLRPLVSAIYFGGGGTTSFIFEFYAFNDADSQATLFTSIVYLGKTFYADVLAFNTDYTAGANAETFFTSAIYDQLLCDGCTKKYYPLGGSPTDSIVYFNGSGTRKYKVTFYHTGWDLDSAKATF